MKKIESRVERYSTKNRIKRKIIKVFKKLIKGLITNVMYLVVGLVYAIYLMIRAFNNFVSKLFMKMPRLIKISIIYLLIANLGLDIYGTFKEDNTSLSTITAIEKEIEPQNTTTNDLTPQNETKTQMDSKCTLDNETACKIKIKAIEYNIDWKIAVSISAWETGHYTSSLYNNSNNVGGLYCNGFLEYESLDEGIEAFVSNLKTNYYDMGLNTIETIGNKYCPIGAKNDPNGLNKNWIPGVTKIYESLGD